MKEVKPSIYGNKETVVIKCVFVPFPMLIIPQKPNVRPVYRGAVTFTTAWSAVHILTEEHHESSSVVRMSLVTFPESSTSFSVDAANTD
ncbi:unnamed protein product [Heligmosomoides polygyrus]|uniref:Uncharacterized protein n=1 Tax=Heligmosomoides polygyrus TaxID=6339 RepID=A0A183GR67_HELPZ|nr:unnamed protein product [Heligmosomoides polygyrus]